MPPSSRNHPTSTPFIFPSVNAALPPWSTTAWPGNWQHCRLSTNVESDLLWQYSSVSDEGISMYFNVISAILDCLAAQSRWQLCIWSDAPKCCLGFQDLSSWSPKLNEKDRIYFSQWGPTKPLQVYSKTWLPLASRLKCYLSSLIHVQSGCYPSNPEHERKRAKTVINHTTTWSNSEQFTSNLKRGRNIVNDWRSSKSGRATSKHISKWRNWHHIISQLRKSSDESPLNFHFNFVDFCPTVPGNLLLTAECRQHKTRTRQVDLQNPCKSPRNFHGTCAVFFDGSLR